MIGRGDGFVLRLPDRDDVEALHAVKNDPTAASQLGGFSRGYSHADIERWIDGLQSRRDDLVWVILDRDGEVVGHCGFYGIDHRVRSADFGVLIGVPSARGRGLGGKVTRHAIDYGFCALNLNRIGLRVLATNQIALALYRSIGFVTDGTLRQARYQAGAYVDVIVMSLLRSEWARDPDQ